MGRPRIHPRRMYRATDSGVYFDPDTGEELPYTRGLHYPNIEVEKNWPHIPMAAQEKMCRKLARVLVDPQNPSFGHLFELADDYPEEIERVGGETKTVE